jgi:hypothetical protein
MPRGAVFAETARQLRYCGSCHEQFQDDEGVVVAEGGKAYHARSVNGKHCYVDHKAQAALMVHTEVGSLDAGPERDAYLRALQSPAGAALFQKLGYRDRQVFVYDLRVGLAEGMWKPFLVMSTHYEGPQEMTTAFGDPSIPLYIPRAAWGTWMAVVRPTAGQGDAAALCAELPKDGAWSLHEFTAAPDQETVEHLYVLLRRGGGEDGLAPAAGSHCLPVDEQGHMQTSRLFPGAEVLYHSASVVLNRDPMTGWIGVGVAAATQTTGRVFAMEPDGSTLYAFDPADREPYPLVLVATPPPREGMATTPACVYNPVGP